MYESFCIYWNLFSSFIFIVSCFFTLYKKTLFSSLAFFNFTWIFSNYSCYSNSIFFDEITNFYS